MRVTEAEGPSDQARSGLHRGVSKLPRIADNFYGLPVRRVPVRSGSLIVQ